MDRFVVMVDAGYLLARSIEIVSNRASRDRRDLVITNPTGLIELLVKQATLAFGLRGRELLRVYWYDGVMPGGFTPQQRSICELPDVNFRSGLVNAKGQQKGVDSLIVTDLLELASNHAVADAALVTGDSDLAVGIDLAQKRGVRIAVLGVEDLAVGVRSQQSREITDRADRVGRFGSSAISPVMRYVSRSSPPAVPGAGAVPAAAVPGAAAPAAALAAAPAPAPAPAPTPGAAPAAVAAAVRAGYARASALSPTDKAAINTAVKEFIAANAPAATVVNPSTKSIDAAVDRALIFHVYTKLAHGQLTPQERVHTRLCFRKQLGCL